VLLVSLNPFIDIGSASDNFADGLWRHSVRDGIDEFLLVIPVILKGNGIGAFYAEFYTGNQKSHRENQTKNNPNNELPVRVPFNAKPEQSPSPNH
jgi:hypothetical protein